MRGKSPAFMAIVIGGYLCGIAHKLLNPPDADASLLARSVLWLYVLDAALVATDLALYLLFRKNPPPGDAA